MASMKKSFVHRAVPMMLCVWRLYPMRAEMVSDVAFFASEATLFPSLLSTLHSNYSTVFRYTDSPNWCSGSCLLDVSLIFSEFIAAISPQTRCLLSLLVRSMARGYIGCA